MSCERCSAPAGVEQSGEAVGAASGHVGRPRRGVAHHSEVSVPLMSVRRPYLRTRLLHPFICQNTHVECFMRNPFASRIAVLPDVVVAVRYRGVDLPPHTVSHALHRLNHWMNNGPHTALPQQGPCHTISQPKLRLPCPPLLPSTFLLHRSILSLLLLPLNSVTLPHLPWSLPLLPPPYSAPFLPSSAPSSLPAPFPLPPFCSSPPSRPSPDTSCM